MQKVFIAVVLALAVCSATAKYTIETAGFAKAPVPVCAGANSTACSNATNLMMIGMSFPDVSVWAYETTATPTNDSSASWKAFTSKINTKDLSTPANSSISFTAPKNTQFRYGYALMVTSENASNIFNLHLYQTKLEGSVALPRIPITQNTNKDVVPVFVGYKIVGKSVVVLHAIGQKLNITSLTLGGSTLGGEYTLTSSYNSSTTSVRYGTGDALGASKVVTIWEEGTTLKQAVYDLSKNTATAGDVKGYNNSLHKDCQPFSTDKKHYGVYCSATVNSKFTIYVSILSNDTGLVKLTDDTGDSSGIAKPYPYAGSLAFILYNSTDTALTFYKTIWNLDTSTAELKLTKIASGETANSGYNIYHIPGAGAYLMLWNRDNTSVPRTDIVVGLILGGSYLTTVFGFLMTIIAGLLLF